MGVLGSMVVRMAVDMATYKADLDKAATVAVDGAGKITAGTDKASAGTAKLSEEQTRAAKEADRLSQSIEKQISAISQQSSTFGMSAAQATMYKLAMEGATGAQLEQAKSALASVEALQSGKDIGEKIGSSVKVGVLAVAAGAAAAYTAFEMLIGSVSTYQDLAEQTGGDPAGLASLRTAADVGGASVDSLVMASNRLQNSLAKTDDESKGVGRALAAIGISVEDFKSLRADEQLRAVAKAMNEYGDGGGKVAVVQEILGRGAASLLPALKELGNETQSNNALTTEQIQLADDYKDAQARSKSEMMQFAERLAVSALPAVTEFTHALKDTISELVGTSAASGDLGKNSAVKEFAGTSAVLLATVVDIAYDAAMAFKFVGDNLGAMAAISVALAHGDLAGARAIGQASDEQNARTLKTLGLADKVQARIDALKAADSFGGGVKSGEMDTWDESKGQKKLDFHAREVKATREVVDENEKLIATVRQGLAASQAEVEAGQKLTPVQREIATLYEKIGLSKNAYTLETLLTVDALMQEKLADEATVASSALAAKAAADAAAQRQKYNADLDKSLGKTQEETQKLQESIDRMGLSKTAVAELDAAQLEAMATTQDRIVLKKIEHGLDEGEYENNVKMSEALRKQAALKRELAGKETQLANIEAERSYWASIEQAAHQTFTSVTQGAQDMGSKVRDAIKAGVFDWLWQITARKWFIDIQANVSGGAGSAAMQAASGGAGGGATSWLSSLFSPGGGVSNLISNVGASLINGPFSSMLGDFGATMISNSSMIAGALPYFGVAIAGLSALRSAMQYTVTPNGGAIVANVGAGGASSVANRTDFIQQGGLFGGGTTYNSSWADADADTTAYIDQAVQAITAGNRAYATALGLNNDALDAYTAQLTINTSGMDAAAAKAAIDGALTQFASDQASAAYGDAIKAFAKDGEKATDTLARLATNLTTANQWAEFFGTTMYDVSVTGAAAASTLIEAFGGLEAMNASLSSYYQNYYTPEEQKQKTIENVQKNLHDNGIDLSIDQLKGATKEGIRAYVEAARLMMLAGQITEAQFAAIVNNANTMAPIATSETPPSTEPGTPGGDALAPFDASAPGETVAQREARYKASASDPFWGLFRGTQSYGGAEGRTGGGDGTTRPMGSGPNGSGPAAGSDANGFQDTIKSWLEKLATTDAGGLDPMRQRDNAYGAFAAQLSLARAGDAKALGSITGYADTYLAAVKDTARTAFEEQMAISKTRAAVGGLLTPEDKVVSAVSQVNRTLVNGFAALTGTAGGVGTGGGLGAAQGGTQGSATVAKALQGIQSDMRVAQVQLLPMVNSLTLLVERWEKKGMPAQRSNA